MVVAGTLAHHARLGCIQMSALRHIFRLEVMAANVEPYRRIERRVLVDQDEGEFRPEVFSIFGRLEVPVLLSVIRDRIHDPVDKLTNAVLAPGRLELAVEVLACHDVGRCLRPARRDLDVALFED